MCYFSYNMMYYRISKNEKILFFGKKNRPGVGSDLKWLSESTSRPPFVITRQACDAKQWSSGLFFFYRTLTLILDSYFIVFFKRVRYDARL